MMEYYGLIIGALSWFLLVMASFNALYILRAGKNLKSSGIIRQRLQKPVPITTEQIYYLCQERWWSEVMNKNPDSWAPVETSWISSASGTQESAFKNTIPRWELLPLTLQPTWFYLPMVASRICDKQGFCWNSEKVVVFIKRCAFYSCQKKRYRYSVNKHWLIKHVLCLCPCGRHLEVRNEIRPRTLLEDLQVSSRYKPMQT